MPLKINSTPLKTIEQLTGEENIPLGDKTHIKSYVIKNALLRNDVSVHGNTITIGNISYTPIGLNPTDVTEQTVIDWGFTKNVGNYIKPVDGITIEDMDSSIQESLERADNAVLMIDVSVNENTLMIGDIVYTPLGLTVDEVTEQTVSNWGFTKNIGNYNKPTGGIPKSDLASTVLTVLEKADSALQITDVTVSENSLKIGNKTYNPINSVNEFTVSGWGFTKNTGTVSDIKMNGSSILNNDGAVDLGTVLTSSSTSLITITDMLKRFEALMTATGLTDKQVITCIRKDSYNDDNWNTLGNSVTEEQYNTYKQSVHNFQNIDMILLMNGDILDCHHFYAIIDVGTNLIGKTMLDMVSWLGDCITFAKDIKQGYVIKFPSYSCPLEDLLADMDAYNICTVVTVGSIFNRIRTYFLDKTYVNREKLFTNSKTSNPAVKYSTDMNNILVSAGINELIKSVFGVTEITEEIYEYIDTAIQEFQDYIDMHYSAESMYRFLADKIAVYNTVYGIAIDDEITNGTVTVSVSSALLGTMITLNAVPDLGYLLDSWNVYNIKLNKPIEVNNNKFMMPISNVAVSALFVVNPDVVTGVSLNETLMRLNVGDTYTIMPIITPDTALDREVTWTSSDTSVVSVDSNGELNALSVGSAVITCLSVSSPSVDASCNIIVEERVDE